MKNSIKSVYEIYKKVKYILNPKQSKGAIVVLLSMLLCAFLDLIGVTVIYPFLDVIVNQETFGEKWYVKIVLFFDANADIKTVLLVLSFVMIFVFLVKNIMAMICSYVQYRYAALFQLETSTMVLNSYMKRPYEFFVNTNSSFVMRGVSADTASVYQILLDGFQAIAELLTTILIGFYLLATDWYIALFAIVLSLTMFLCIFFLFKNIMKKAGKNARDSKAEQSKCLVQAIQGIKEITALDRRDFFVKQYKDAAADYANNIIINNTVIAAPNRIIEGVCMSGFILLILVRVTSNMDMALFVPKMGAFAMGAFKILPSISKISSRVNNIIYNQIGLDKCYQNLKEVRAIETLKTNRQKQVAKRSDVDGKHIFNRELCINDIVWKYRNSKENVLQNMSLSIHKGQSVALIGQSGAGKTTLADIILGLLEPQSGTVEVDGVSIYDIPYQWAKTIGYVPQTVYLIDDTIRANIAFGVDEDLVDDNKIWNALEQAQLKSYVEKLPHKLDTFVGERGVKFSGGQRQRIAIARALYEDPDILVLDEATSALDSETETAVMESIDALQQTKTLIIVAHRLSTIKNCDIIYEIGNGIAVVREKEEVLG